jgi:glutaredoxin
MKKCGLLAILVLACIPVQADVYRWVDAQGKVQYSDQLPPPDIKKVERVKTAAGKPGDAPLPYALQQAVNNFPVILFTSPCGEACSRAGELLAKRGVPYTEMDATDPAAQQELKKVTGGPLQVPVLKVGPDVLKGFEERGWNTSLDAAGYPQTAAIPPRAPTKPVKPAAATQSVTTPPAAMPAEAVPPAVLPQSSSSADLHN